MRIQSSLRAPHVALSTFSSSLIGVGMMVLALWGWQHSARLADGWIGYGDSVRPDVAKWAVRCGAIAVAAVSQGMFVVAVWGRLYQRQLIDTLVKVVLGLVFAIAVVSAIALGLAAR